MKMSTVILVLGVTLLCTNASILEHLYNNTHLRGNMQYNTDKGLKLGYNGSLIFNNGILGFEIAKLGGSFIALPKTSEGLLGPVANRSVDYSGEIHVGHGEHQAAVAVNGTAGLSAEFEKEETEHGVKAGYNATLRNHARWNANAGQNGAEGTTGAFANVSGHAFTDGKQIFLKQRYRGAVAVAGNASHGEGNDTRFVITNFGKGGARARVFVRPPRPGPRPGPRNDAIQLGHLFPTVAYEGGADFERAQFAKMDDHKVTNLADGRSMFSGLVWTEAGGNNETFFRNIRHAKTVDFGHKGKTIVDNETVALNGGKGIVASYDIAELRVNKTGQNLKAGFLSTGDLHHDGIIIPHPKPDDEVILEKQFGSIKRQYADELNGGKREDQNAIDSENYDEDDHHKKIKTSIHARWGASTGVHAQRNDDDTVDVDTRGGALWDADGSDSKHKKPWHHRGAESYNSTFEIDPNNAVIRDIQIQLAHNVDAIEELNQLFQTRENMGNQLMRE